MLVASKRFFHYACRLKRGTNCYSVIWRLPGMHTSVRISNACDDDDLRLGFTFNLLSTHCCMKERIEKYVFMQAYLPLLVSTVIVITVIIFLEHQPSKAHTHTYTDMCASSSILRPSLLQLQPWRTKADFRFPFASQPSILAAHKYVTTRKTVKVNARSNVHSKRQVNWI